MARHFSRPTVCYEPPHGGSVSALPFAGRAGAFKWP